MKIFLLILSVIISSSLALPLDTQPGNTIPQPSTLGANGIAPSAPLVTTNGVNGEGNTREFPLNNQLGNTIPQPLTLGANDIAPSAPLITTDGLNGAPSAPIVTTDGLNGAPSAPLLTTDGLNGAPSAPIVTTDGLNGAPSAPLLTTDGLNGAPSAPLLTTVGLNGAPSAPLLTTVGLNGQGNTREFPTLVNNQRDNPLDNISDFCNSSCDTLSDGTQIRGGSCSSGTQGAIPSANKMTSSLIVSPNVGAIIPAGRGFNVSVHMSNFETGFFSNPKTQYNIQPQTLNKEGFIKGHSHITIQNIGSATRAPDAETFVFFKGLEAKSNNGILSVSVPDGTINEPGNYRICSMAGSFTHQPLVMPVAQRGSQDDCIRIVIQ